MNARTVKLGPKGRHLKLPPGWRVVTEGECRPGDRFANVGNPNAPFWVSVETTDIGDPAEWFECLIRFCGPDAITERP